ncbi:MULTISPECIES: glycoside hydrolase family 28 protein [Pseudomonas syringae group]|uniref:Glycoside hydrolase family 28 protein n=3 Tax=Pseudomonas syringae group TaxID=136849 RepID=A0AAW4DZP6_PSESX|nr:MULTISPECIES: glycoside hydrolase family 28 protein [Pseudomonas syringae group]AVI83957.1 polygalacturonase [Pseudomonas syringae pv. tomato]EEB59040.1 polygalacturonase [Pseudomonas syringae pv. tomato T1]KGK94074.1 polygalacturonase [Pseudomonas syringae pv. tomato]KUR45326.1 Polygalacturonase precursor [Pseudomonas syringae pv. tomato]KUR48144.1 Polygalacturonase precursor [Pseudomonas syringae pv. tomato]
MSGAAHFSNSVFRKTSWAMTSLTASLMIAAPVQAAGEAAVVTPWGTINEPASPQVCKQLPATLAPKDGSLDSVDSAALDSRPDQDRIQSAINGCAAGQAVQLVKGTGDNSAFLSGALQLKSGVTLWIDDGVTLFASRNPKDYDNGKGTCGVTTVANQDACSALISAKNTRASGVIGKGVIDGRGGSLLTSGANAKQRSWWDLVYQKTLSNAYQQKPRLIQVSGGADFVIQGVTLQNAPDFNIVTDGVTGVTVWGIKILTPSRVYTVEGYHCPTGSTPDQKTPGTCFTPETVKNTDGFDPGQSNKVLLAYSYISTGDDNVAIKSSRTSGSRDLMFAHNHFYYGHGLSIGSETNGGVHNVSVVDLAADGADSQDGIGLRIKSGAKNGGIVDGVSYENVCMRNVKFPLVFDTQYGSASGTSYPDFSGITVKGFHYLGSPRFGGGKMTFVGYNDNGQKRPISITLDNVVFDGTQPNLTGLTATHFILGPGPVSFANKLVPSIKDDVTVSGSPGEGTPVDCTAAFVPMKSVVPGAPF